MRPVSVLLITLICNYSVYGAWAYSAEEFSLERKVQLSDAVVIGRVVSEPRKLDTNSAFEYNTIHTEITLKGTVPKSFDFINKTGIPEDEPDCCEVGKVYLLFLRNLRNNKYEFINGMFGAYKINPR